MKNTTILIIAVLALLGMGFFLTRGSGAASTGSTISDETIADAQKVTLSMKNGNYFPQEVRVKAGKPVEITLDKSINGCYRSLVIRGLGVSTYSKSPGETISFTTSKPGTYRFTCSMGMGYGTLVVE